MFVFFFKQKTAYEMRISDWSQTCALPISRDAGRDAGSDAGQSAAERFTDAAVRAADSRSGRAAAVRCAGVRRARVRFRRGWRIGHPVQCRTAEAGAEKYGSTQMWEGVGQ